MSNRGLIRGVFRAAAGAGGGAVTREAVIAKTKLDRKLVSAELSNMVASGELFRSDDGYTVNPDFVLLPPGRKRGDRLPKKLKGFRAEARKRRARKRSDKGGELRTEADVLRKHLVGFRAPGFEVIRDYLAAQQMKWCDATSPVAVNLSVLARSTFAVVVALLPELDAPGRSALAHAMEAHAKVLAALS